MNTYARYRLWGSAVVIPLLLASSICMLKYAGWSAVVSAHYGEPGYNDLVASAQHEGGFYFWVMIGLSTTAFITLLVVLPSMSKELPPGLRGTLRSLVALGLVILGNIGGGYLLISFGRHLK